MRGSSTGVLQNLLRLGCRFFHGSFCVINKINIEGSLRSVYLVCSSVDQVIELGVSKFSNVGVFESMLVEQTSQELLDMLRSTGSPNATWVQK